MEISRLANYLQDIHPQHITKTVLEFYHHFLAIANGYHSDGIGASVLGNPYLVRYQAWHSLGIFPVEIAKMGHQFPFL